MNKRTELFFDECRASVSVESNSDDDSITFSITEHDVNEKKSTNAVEHLEPVSTTEIYIGHKEATAIFEALLETLDEDQEVI